MVRLASSMTEAAIGGGGGGRGIASRALTGGVAAVALALFSLTAREFTTSVTDLSALRILAGELPYRDFWTMYAPGSLYAAAAGFALFGRELMVSHLLGLLTACAAVAALHRLLLTTTSPAAASGGALLFACAFFHSGYQNSLASYPLSILCIWLGAGRLFAYIRTRRRRALVVAGICIGLAVCCKHDLGGYACLAGAATLLAGGIGPASIALLAATVLGVILIPLLPLITAGAGTDLFADLVLFPLTDFRHVRQEFFPLLPHLTGRPLMGNVRWALLSLPSLALAAGLLAGWRRRRDLETGVLPQFVFAGVLFALVWNAAHVQINTHLVTMTGLGAWAGLAGLAPRSGPAGRRPWLRRTVRAAAIVWACALLYGPAERLRTSTAEGLQPAGLPGLRGILVPPDQAAWMSGLAGAMQRAGPPESPLLLVGRRNDVLIYASSRVYWLSQRRMVTRHHELHPGVTDTEAVQRRMLADLESGPPPVVVREHRFGDDHLDRVAGEFRARGVPVGSTLLDTWIQSHYEDGERYGMYEVLRRK
jgi:hypothetical protein